MTPTTPTFARAREASTTSTSSMTTVTSRSHPREPPINAEQPDEGSEHDLPLPLNDHRRLEAVLAKCESGDLLDLFEKERRRWHAIPHELFERPPASPESEHPI